MLIIYCANSGSSIFKMDGKYPVVEGVFSYMLWGTCRGRKEPTYYNKVKIGFFWLEIKLLFKISAQENNKFMDGLMKF